MQDEVSVRRVKGQAETAVLSRAATAFTERSAKRIGVDRLRGNDSALATSGTGDPPALILWGDENA